jgi:hypothetical protein
MSYYLPDLVNGNDVYGGDEYDNDDDVYGSIFTGGLVEGGYESFLGSIAVRDDSDSESYSESDDEADSANIKGSGAKKQETILTEDPDLEVEDDPIFADNSDEDEHITNIINEGDGPYGDIDDAEAGDLDKELAGEIQIFDAQSNADSDSEKDSPVETPKKEKDIKDDDIKIFDSSSDEESEDEDTKTKKTKSPTGSKKNVHSPARSDNGDNSNSDSDSDVLGVEKSRSPTGSKKKSPASSPTGSKKTPHSNPKKRPGTVKQRADNVDGGAEFGNALRNYFN